LSDIPEDLQAAYAAEASALAALTAQRAVSIKLSSNLALSQVEVRKLAVPYEQHRATRRVLEQTYGIGEWAPSGIPDSVVGGG
jgi:hypothetical protein